MSKTQQDFRVKSSRLKKVNPLTSTLSLMSSKKKLSPLRINKYNVFMDCLNDLTQQRFDASKSRVTFQQIEERVRKNSLLCILFIQNMQVFNNYDLPNLKVPPKFSWEAIYEGKTLQLTTPHSYGRTCHGLVDFMFKSNARHPLKLKLWKVKNYEESYIGEIELSVSDFVDFEVALEFQGKMIKETFVQKEMYKVFNESSASIGQVSLKIIQFCSSSVPSNKLSNIPGSPRTQEQRKRHNCIEDSRTKEFDWGSSKDEDYIIFLIGEAVKEINNPKNIEEVLAIIAEIDAQLNILKDIYFETNPASKRLKISVLKRRREEMQAILMQMLINDAQYLEVFSSLRNIGLKGRIKRQDIEAALQTLGCKASQLVFLVQDEFGMCLMDFLLEGDSLPEIIILFNELCETQTLEVFAHSLFDNIRHRLRKNHYLKALCAFLKALALMPQIGLIIQEYAYSEENIIITSEREAPFCVDFNLDDYQHVMVLSKVYKLCKPFLKDDIPFMISLRRTYEKAKKSTYFKIPMLPKKITEAKIPLLILEELRQNIFHEIVRRKRWNLFHRAHKEFEDLVYQQDNDGISPMMMFLENAPLDSILQIEGLRDQISFRGKTSLHFLLMNPDLSVSSLLGCISKFNILNEKIWQGFTPLALFLERLVHKQKKHKSRIIKEMKAALENSKKIQIIDLLAQNTIQLLKSFNFGKYLLYAQNVNQKQFKMELAKIPSDKPFDIQYNYDERMEQWDQFYHQHTVPALMLCRLDENIQELIWPQFEWINWLVTKNNYPFERYNQQTLLNAIVKTNQSQVVYQYLLKETPISYRDQDHYYQETDKFNYVPVFQILLNEELLQPKLKEDIIKKYRPVKEIIKEDQSFKAKVKLCHQLISQQKYQVVLDMMIDAIEQAERSLQNSFKYNHIVLDLINSKNLNFSKLFRKAYDSKFDNQLNFIDILLKSLTSNNITVAHQALFFAQLRNNQLRRVAQVKQLCFLQSLQTHWAIELDINQFQAMLIDVKDISTQNEINKIIYILAMNGRFNKLKLVIEKMTNQNYLIQALPIAAHQIQLVKNHRYYEELNELLHDSDVKRLYHEDTGDFLKPSKDKFQLPVRKPFEKQKPVFCKWVALQGVLQTQLQTLYKQTINQRVKSEQQIINKHYLQFWNMEYAYKLRRLFPRQNFKSIFYQTKPKESDYVKTVELLIEKILFMKLTPTDEFFNYIHVHEKFSELLSQSPNQNVCIVMAFKSMINLFQNEQTNEVLLKCINFLKKYLNSKIYKDLNEQSENFGKEGFLLQKYLKKGDPQSTQNRFAQEVVLLMDQNFTTQEYESMTIIEHPSSCASNLLKLKSVDKRVMAFIQKYLNTGFVKKQFISFSPSNMEYIISLAKAGVTLMQDNALEQLLQRGLHLYLKNYFMNALRPKGMLSDDQKLYYLQFAISSGSPDTIQLCIEDLCSLKNNELKQMIIEGSLLGRAMVKASSETLLFLTRKVFKLCNFSSKDILKILHINDTTAEFLEMDRNKKQPFLSMFLMNCEIFYKEFFIDYLQKILGAEYKNVMLKIFNAKVFDCTIFQLGIETGFYDLVQSAVTLNLQLDLSFLQELNIMSLPTRWIFQPPQQLENLLKQEHYKLIYKQSALKLYRICKYHLSKSELLSNLNQLRQLEICLNIAPLLQSAQIHINPFSRDSIIEIILDNEINPEQKPLLFLMKMLLDQEDKNNNFILVESFCDKHPQIMHDKFYTQIIKNREAYELLRQYYPEQNKENRMKLDVQINSSDNIVKEYLILQDPIRFFEFISSNKQIIYALRVLYDKNQNLEEFFQLIQENTHIIIVAVCLLVLNTQKYQEIVFQKFQQYFELPQSEASPVTQIFKSILNYFEGIQGTFIFFVQLIQSLMTNVVYQQLILVKPIGDLNNSIISERQFLEEIKQALQSDNYTLPDNIWSLIIQSSTKAIHALQSDKWFHGFCLIKTILHVAYAAESVIHEIQSTSQLDDYHNSDFWGIQKLQLEIKVDLHPADQVAQHKVVVLKHNDDESWKLKYPLGMVKDNHYIYPTIMSTQKGTEFAKYQIIQMIFELQKKSKMIQHPDQFTFDGVTYENVQQLIAETYQIQEQITKHPDNPIIYNGKTLSNNNYITKRKNKKEFSLAPTTTAINVQIVSKDEYLRREKSSFIFNQILEDPPTKIWTYYIESTRVDSLKDDLLIHEIYYLIQSKLPPKCHVNLPSFVETYFSKIALGLEKTYKKSTYSTKLAITPKICIDLGLQWDLLFKIMKIIAADLQFADHICFEMAEVDVKKTFNIKLDGFDSVFRFGQVELFVLSPYIVVRLNVAIISQGFNALINNNVQSLKQRLNEVKESPEIQTYLNAIYNDSILQGLLQQ